MLVTICFSCNLFGQTFENISVTEAKELLENSTENELFTIFDVRTPDEYLPEHIAGAFMRNFYDEDFDLQLDSLDKNREYLIYCRSGSRSGQAFQMMQNLGFQTVCNMLDGMNSWNASGYPVTDEIPAYVDIYASVTSSIEIVTNSKIDIYPNPVTNLLTIKSSLSLHEYIDIDKVGKIVLRGFLQNNKINVTDLKQGLYNIVFLNVVEGQKNN